MKFKAYFSQDEKELEWEFYADSWQEAKEKICKKSKELKMPNRGMERIE